MKIRTTVLAGAGAVSGLVMAASVPAGASAAPSPQLRATLCTGTLYQFTGNVTDLAAGGQPDQALLKQAPGLSGSLCIGDNHGNNGEAAPVTGFIGFDNQAVPSPTATTSAILGRTAGIQVKGVTVGDGIRFDGRTTLDLATAAKAATTSAAAPTRVQLFMRATGEQLTALQRLGAAMHNAPAYGGSFDGPRQGESGQWNAFPADQFNK